MKKSLWLGVALVGGSLIVSSARSWAAGEEARQDHGTRDMNAAPAPGGAPAAAGTADRAWFVPFSTPTPAFVGGKAGALKVWAESATGQFWHIAPTTGVSFRDQAGLQRYCAEHVEPFGAWKAPSLEEIARAREAGFFSGLGGLGGKMDTTQFQARRDTLVDRYRDRMLSASPREQQRMLNDMYRVMGDMMRTLSSTDGLEQSALLSGEYLPRFVYNDRPLPTENPPAVCVAAGAAFNRESR